MKKNNILPIFIIIFDLLIILLSKNVFKRKIKHQIIFNTLPISKRSNRGIKSYKRHILTKRIGRKIHSNSSNDEILELIKQFLGGKKR